MVGEELHGDHSQDGLQGVHSLGHLNHFSFSPSGSLGVAGLTNNDWPPVPEKMTNIIYEKRNNLHENVAMISYMVRHTPLSFT